MKLTFINITSYQGISSAAEHFYAKVARPGYNGKYLVLDYGWSLDACSDDFKGEELRYIPDEATAREMAKKDYGRDMSYTEAERIQRIEVATADILEYGTTRFPSVVEILREARRRHPDSFFYVTFCRDHKNFIKYFCCRDGKEDKEVTSLLLPKDYDDEKD